MPCDAMIQQYRQAIFQGQEYIVIDSENPFAKAVESELAKQGIRAASEIRMYFEDKLTLQVDMNTMDQWGSTTRKREQIDLLIEELHDMAVKFLPKPDPNKPMTFEDLRKHFHPKAPKDLLDQPLPSMHRKFVEVKTIDGYKYEEVWEVPTPKTEEPVEEEKDDVIDTLVSQYKEDLKRRIAQKKKK